MRSGNSRGALGVLLDAIDACAAEPAERAVSLPPEAYTSPELYALERERIFSKEWICVGREDEVQSPGDFFTANVNQVPVVIVRNDDREVIAWANVCRHRMARIVEGSGRKRLFVCPYHAWSYDLTGQLVRAPNMVNERFDKANCRLPRIRLETWLGFIYVNLDPDAEPLAVRLEPLTELARRYGVARMRTVWKKKAHWRTNWKALVENFLETYHIPVVHSETLLPYGGSDLVERLPPGDGFGFYVQHQDRNAEIGEDVVSSKILLENPDMTDEERFKTPVGCVFPTHLMSISWFGVLWLSLQPQGPGAIDIDWGVVGPVAGLPVNAESYEDYGFPAWIDIVNNEDKPRVEAVQLGAESGFAQAGPLHARHEETLLGFMRYLSRKLGP